MYVDMLTIFHTVQAGNKQHNCYLYKYCPRWIRSSSRARRHHVLIQHRSGGVHDRAAVVTTDLITYRDVDSVVCERLKVGEPERRGRCYTTLIGMGPMPTGLTGLSSTRTA